MGWFASPRHPRWGASASQRFRLSHIERHTILREMAKGELGRREMSGRRQREFIKYAQRLGIDAAEAAEVIDEARRAMGMPVAPPPREQTAVCDGEAVRPVATWLAVSIVVMAIVIVNLLLLRVP